MEDIKYWIWLSRIEGLTPKFLLELLQKYKTPKKIFNLSEEKLILDGIKESNAKKITEPKFKQNIDKYISYMKNNNIGLINIYDNRYPKMLKQIYDSPVILYFKGNIDILNDNCIGMVGCRKSTNYGMNVAKNLSYNLSLNNINIVSGLARGIDKYSHIGSLNAKGKTIAVVGCGLDRVYPEENKELFNKIVENKGCVISEYVIGTKPLAKNFPQRNRIISGLSKGVIIVEAKEKSGTLITADFALEQGKELYVVPGNITSQNSFGTNELIKQGAKLITKYEDVLEDII